MLRRYNVILRVWFILSLPFLLHPLETYAAAASSVAQPLRQDPTWQQGYGHVDVPITCNTPHAQRAFNQALAMLYNFDAHGADHTFRHIAQLDPTCAVAYWGMALANVAQPKRFLWLLRQAVARKHHASARGQRWIDALAGLLPPAEANADSLNQAAAVLRPLPAGADATGAKAATVCFSPAAEAVKGNRALVAEALAMLALANPLDTEVQALYVWQKVAMRLHGEPITVPVDLDRWIQNVLAVQPHHPVQGSLAFVWEHAQPQRALAAAEQAVSVTPRHPHLWRLMGQLYANAHRYADAVTAFDQAVQHFAEQRQRHGLMPDEMAGYAEARDGLARNLARIGRVHEALAIARSMAQMPCSRDSDVDIYLAPDPHSHRVIGARRWLGLLVEFELWEDLAGMDPDAPFFGPMVKVDLLYAQTRAAFVRGDLPYASERMADLRYSYSRSVDKAYFEGGHLHGHSRDGKKAAKVLPLRISYIQQYIRELLLYQALAEGNLDDLRDRLQKVPESSTWWLAPFYWAIGERDTARRIAQQTWRADPQRVITVARSVDFLWHTDQAHTDPELRTAWQALAKQVNPALPIARRLAEAFASEQPALASTYGTLPPTASSTASVNHLAWRPYPAPDFAFRDIDGKRHSLTQYQGQSVLLVFDPGVDCPECLAPEQDLAKAAPHFAKAGIRVLAIRTGQRSGAPDRLPFRVVPEHLGQVLQDYEVRDTLRQAPLSGIFLLDPNGLIRWRQISPIPFLNWRFLFREAKHVLGTPLQH